MADRMPDYEIDRLLHEEIPAGAPPAGFVDRVMLAREQDRIRPRVPPRRYRLLSWLAASLAAAAAAVLAIWILIPDTVWQPRPAGVSPTLKLAPPGEPAATDTVTPEHAPAAEQPGGNDTTGPESAQPAPERSPEQRGGLPVVDLSQQDLPPGPDAATAATTTLLDACKELERDHLLKKAEACYREVLEKKPGIPEAHLRLGAVYAKTNRIKPAYREYRRFVELAPLHMMAPRVRLIMQQYEEYKETNMSHDARAHPEDPPPHVHKGDEPLDDATIARTIRKYLPALRGCVARQRQRDPGVSGTMSISLTIQPDGSVSRVEPDSPAYRHTYAFGCITFVIEHMKFPAFEGEAFRVPSIPFKLR